MEQTDTSSPETQHDWIYFAGRRIARYDQNSGWAAYYQYNDANASLRVMTDASGNVLCQADYYPFGDTIGTGCSNDTYHEFADLFHDGGGRPTRGEAEDGGYSAGHRRFAPGWMRWNSPDPAGVKVVLLTDPQSWNMYMYSHDDPVTFNDPSGLHVCGKHMTATQCKGFQAGLDKAQNAANALKQRYGTKSKQYTEAERAISAYGKAGVDNGVTVDIGSTGKDAALTTPTHATGKKTMDNPTGQIINVTISGAAVGDAMDEAHEGSHVADASAWVASGFSRAMDPTNNQTELRAYQVGAAIGQGLGYIDSSATFGPRQYLLGTNTVDPMGAVSDWLIERMLQNEYKNLDGPAFQ